MAAGVDRLERWRYEDMVDRYCQRFPLDPDKVFNCTTFDTISLFLCKWNEEQDYQDSYIELERQMNSIPKPTQ